MYKIIKDGDPYAYVETPRYIKQNSRGIFVSATEADAQGIALDGTPYNLFNREAMDGVEDTVMISALDAGIVVYSQQENINNIILSVLEG